MFDKAVRTFVKVADIVTMIAAVVAGISFWLLLVMVVTDVALRYIFNSPLFFAQEMSIYFMSTLVFMGLAYTLLQGGHIRVTILVGRLKPRLRALFDLSMIVFGLIWGMLLLSGTLNLWLYNFKDNTHAYGSLGAPLWIPGIFTVIGSALVMLALISMLLRSVIATFARRGEPPYLIPGGGEG